MPYLQVSDSLALAIAASVGFPDEKILGSDGTKLEYQGKRYLLAIREGRYVAFDISVFVDGDLVTDPFDVYWQAIKSGLKESTIAIWDFSKVALLVVLAVLALIAVLRVTSAVK